MLFLGSDQHARQLSISLRDQQERDHMPPIREKPSEMAPLSIDQIEVRRYVGGLIKSFERKVA